jgi:plasmid maintenance system antidote protein VapI
VIGDDESALRLSVALLTAGESLKQFQALSDDEKVEFAQERAGLSAKELARAMGRQTEIMAMLSELQPDDDSEDA